LVVQPPTRTGGLLLPTFIGLGSQKCASTWLDGVLRQHPQVQMPAKKELNYLSRHILRYDLEWYSSRFGGERPAPAAIARGEISPSYARMAPDTVKRLRRLLPGLRILLMIRDPVDRAWSQLVFEVEYLRRRDFQQWSTSRMLRYLERVRNRRYGDYLVILRRWQRAFGGDAVWLGIVDELRANPRALLREVAEHIDVDPDWEPPEALLAPRFEGHSLTGKPTAGMPPVVGWYLAKHWLEPTRALNEHLDGRVSHWVRRMERLTEEGRWYWPVCRVAHRRIAAMPERVAYAAHDRRLALRLRRRYAALQRTEAERLAQPASFSL
jgi:hypothetical protein